MNSIRSHLTRQLVLVLAVLLGTGLFAIYTTVRQALVRSFDSTLLAQALAVSALTETEAGQVQTDFPADFLHGFGNDHPRSYFELWDAAGAVLTRSASLLGVDLPLPVDGTPDRPKYWNIQLPNRGATRAVGFTFQPRQADDAPPRPALPQAVRLVVAVDAGKLDESLGGLLAGVTSVGALLFLAVFLTVPRVLRRGLAPLSQFAEQTARINAASLASRFSSRELPAELQPIGDRLNDLLARLESSFERERRFSADLAHELRTPIAELRSLAECALKWPGDRDPACDRDVLAIAAQMEALVTRMLTLARGERGQLAIDLSPVELAALTARAWQPFAGRAAARQLRPSLALAPSTLPADPVLLQSILSNLFDNAVSYAPPGSELRVTGRTTDHGYLLQVANPAGGLGPVDMTRLFDRFWRKDTARSGGEHFGLGLSLARTFAAAMGWHLAAEIDSQNWIVFTLAAAPLEKNTTG